MIVDHGRTLGIYTDCNPNVFFFLQRLADHKEFTPQKYFSIDRVFRNETLDATHLAEFHQIEGVIADYGLTLGDLIGNDWCNPQNDESKIL